MHCKSKEEENPESVILLPIAGQYNAHVAFTWHKMRITFVIIVKKKRILMIFLWPEHAPRGVAGRGWGWRRRRGLASCHGVTGHAVHAGGIAAGTGSLYNSSRWAQTCRAALHPLPSPLHTQLVSSPHSLPHVESQTKRNALFVFWWDDVGVVITSVFRENA